MVYRKASFDIEPIQPPIVPLKLFRSHSLRTTTACKHAALRGPLWLCSVAAQSSSQSLEVRELAELRRQRAAQAGHRKSPATARVGSNRGSGGADHTTCSTRTTPHYASVHPTVAQRCAEGPSQVGELRHRADPAADRAAELVLVTFSAHHHSV